MRAQIARNGRNEFAICHRLRRRTAPSYSRVACRSPSGPPAPLPLEIISAVTFASSLCGCRSHRGSAGRASALKIVSLVLAAVALVAGVAAVMIIVPASTLLADDAAGDEHEGEAGKYELGGGHLNFSCCVSSGR